MINAATNLRSDNSKHILNFVPKMFSSLNIEDIKLQLLLKLRGGAGYWFVFIWSVYLIVEQNEKGLREKNYENKTLPAKKIDKRSWQKQKYDLKLTKTG